MKYEIWNVSQPEMGAVNEMVSGGYPPLAAMVLSARGLQGTRQAQQYLSCQTPLLDPYLMTDMPQAAMRLSLALENGEKIAVFGDYDVDGITATCLLTDFLRTLGGDCIPYIPGRLEEGYGLNPIAIHQLKEQGVQLIVTVDCGITAMEEAKLCKQLGIDLVITDHHECKETLPEAIAVVDPHRPDGGYPHLTLSGVGVAFKLAAALCGDQDRVLQDYADLVCLGTVADVMPLQGENRVFVSRGIDMLRNTKRPGIAALMGQSNCDPDALTASSVGYILAPRINAAGRMGQIELAIELFLTKDPDRAMLLAEALCDLNRQRQAVEAQIYEQAVQMLPKDKAPEAIVLADESWHQGVVGIVASRIAEEYCCPTFLICLDGNHGKASSRSYGGFNLFTALTVLKDILESYGGHELAAGFTIGRLMIPTFREQIGLLASAYYQADTPRTVLDADCAVTGELLTLQNIQSLNALEPCGNGCPKPVLVLEHATIERMNPVGNGRHLRLSLRQGRFTFNAIYFNTTAESASVAIGDTVDVAFLPQINEFKGNRTVQLNLVDIRPSCKAACTWDTSAYRALQHDRLDAAVARSLLPDREMLATVWRYLAASGSEVKEAPMCLCRKIVRWSDKPLSLGQLLTCLDIFADVDLLETKRQTRYISIRLLPCTQKADLLKSITMQRLIAAKEH